MTLTKVVIILTLILIMLATPACGPDTVIGNLQLALDGLQLLLPVIGPAANIPPDLQLELAAWGAAVNTGLGKSIVIWNGPGTTASKSAQIAALMSGIAAPIVPKQYSLIASTVQTILQDVASFLASLPPAAGTTSPIPSAMRPSASTQAQTPASDKPVRLSTSQQRKIDKALKTAQTNAEQFKALMVMK